MCGVHPNCLYQPACRAPFYRQFAITIASATVISCSFCNTLSPALAAILLKTARGGALKRTLLWWLGAPLRWFFAGFNFVFDRLSRGYVGR